MLEEAATVACGHRIYGPQASQPAPVRHEGRGDPANPLDTPPEEVAEGSSRAGSQPAPHPLSQQQRRPCREEAEAPASPPGGRTRPLLPSDPPPCSAHAPAPVVALSPGSAQLSGASAPAGGAGARATCSSRIRTEVASAPEPDGLTLRGDGAAPASRVMRAGFGLGGGG